LRVYLDACALSRLTDNPAQLRVGMEAGAVRQIFRLVEEGIVQWVASSVLETEVRNNPDIRRRTDTLELLQFAAELIFPDHRIATRAGLLHAMGYGKFDALHLALAETANVDSLLTTDDRFLRQIGRRLGNPSLPAANPLEWIKGATP
jgi:predicted nucleic acid-binding protein